MKQQALVLADALPPLLMAARQIAGSVMGAHGRRQAGPGDSFWQYRVARPGDSLRQIDWRQSARSQSLQVRETEWAAAQTVHVWCDSGDGMDWRSQATLPTKSQRALVLTLAASLLALRGGERVCPFGSAPISGEHQVERVALSVGLRADPVPGPTLAPGHSVLLVSDFLAPLDHWESVLKALSRRGAAGHLLQVLDPAEETFPFSGRIVFRHQGQSDSVELGRAQDVAASYRERIADHCRDLTSLAQSQGWTCLKHRTDHSAQTALLALYTRLSERAR